MDSSSAKRFLAGLLASLLVTAALPATPAKADSVAELLDRARSEAAQNKPLDALQSAQGAVNQLWAASPLFLNQALFTKGKAAGFGIYDPRPDTVFSQTDPLYVYLQPAGYGFQLTGELIQFGFVVDLAVLDASGRERGGAKDFTKFDYVSRTANKEITLIFTVDPLKLTPGNYGLKITVHDKVKNQSVAKMLPFAIRP